VRGGLLFSATRKPVEKSAEGLIQGDKMRNRLLTISAAGIFALLGQSAGYAEPVQVKVTITSLAPANGAAFSPVFIGAHDGTYTSFTSGTAAGAGIRNVAELGSSTSVASEFATVQPNGIASTIIASTNGFGPGIFLPGGSGSAILILDPVKNRYLNFGSMVVPSNDTFMGNASPTAVPLFDANGSFIAQTFTVSGSQLWDAGSEVNGLSGAAFVAGSNAMDRTAENSVVTQINATTQFTPYLNASTPANYTFTKPPAATDQVASFSFQVVPEPTSIALFGAITAFVIGRRRK
jgi:hypothetical protein